MEAVSGVTRSIVDELHSWYIQDHEMEGESGVTRSTSMNFIPGISKAMKCKVKALCCSMYHRQT